MEILWWLAPPVVATALAMLWVSWVGRASRGAVDREVAVRRLGAAMAKPSKVSARAAVTRPVRPGERGTGVAVRPSSRVRPDPQATPTDEAATRRAS